MTTSLNVHIGEIKTGRHDHELHTILGSCIGIGILWKKRGLYGLAHCLLPNSSNDQFEFGGRFVDQAVPSLYQVMEVTSGRDIRAIVAGGANMTLPNSDTPEKLVGYQNARAAVAQLERMRIRIIHEDTGGLEGRKMSICCSTGDFTIRKIPRMSL